jgi:hypothetical protein
MASTHRRQSALGTCRFVTATLSPWNGSSHASLGTVDSRSAIGNRQPTRVASASSSGTSSAKFTRAWRLLKTRHLGSRERRRSLVAGRRTAACARDTRTPSATSPAVLPVDCRPSDRVIARFDAQGPTAGRSGTACHGRRGLLQSTWTACVAGWLMLEALTGPSDRRACRWS